MAWLLEDESQEPHIVYTESWSTHTMDMAMSRMSQTHVPKKRVSLHT